MIDSIFQVSRQLHISEKQIKVVLDFLNEGSTVPFIARYRQANTGGLDEEQIEAINVSYQYTIQLNKRKEAIIALLAEKELLTPDIHSSITTTNTKSALEAIYEPFKEGKATKATKAIKLGLEPLAKLIWESVNENFSPLLEAKQYLNDEVKDVDFAIEQVQLIIAQWMSQDIKARKIAKDFIFKTGNIVSKKKKKAEDGKERFAQYYDHKELLVKIPNHRVMAIDRAEKLKIINVDLEFDDSKVMFDLNKHFVKIIKTESIFKTSLSDASKRLIMPSIKREIRSELFDKAEISAIKLFANNLEEMLLAPSIGEKVILSIDPAFASGCKVAVLAGNGDVLKIDLIKPTAPFNRIEESTNIINKLIDQYHVDIIVIGNGTASRETEAFVANVVKNRKDSIPFAIVSEVGASVYSASKIAIKEFPDLSVEQRSAINIGRRFQDPLNELVKIDPRAIGVGQYQHDVNQKELSNSLIFKVNKVVNTIGVNINSATPEILSYIAGISPKVAENIISYRKENGIFKNRKQIKKVKGLGPKTFEQAIGFMRIHNSKTFYDKTQIHPESYKLADQIVNKLNIDLENIDKALLTNINLQSLAEAFDSNEYDIKLIIDSIREPGKDIREQRDGPLLKTDVLKIEDLKEGMQLEGTVQNITDFGVFVYIGIKQAAFIHISKMSDKFISHSSDIVKTGKNVIIEIIKIEIKRGRIQAKLVS
ncbi:helix-hairpin-helix domain-containing protein [Candidatus Mycoplasma mahonii]|uniref:helix-hairpin-helix domain-containing protein n=1 Tax=Candidatus Mycoplasma mahonii TaxID=3004105 RepID=UPI0026EE9A5C|nr:Tex-like N-terminal domain-containing protein [Candidatus Mycoplasma mahonii]WKX02810.1 helix-hairpin-helix domain-containing protein [Candidatus Mycoplasma mahonii]